MSRDRRRACPPLTIVALATLALAPGLRAGPIQDAIDAASDGDVVVIEPGTYAETVDFGGKAITVRSAGGAEVTTIDASSLGTVPVRFLNGEGPDSVLEGFTITGGSASSGGGAVIDAGASPTIVDCRFVGNDALFDGGGCFSNGGSPTFVDCLFDGNAAANGGGGALAANGGSPVLVGCTFLGNGAFIGGGGLALSGTGGAVRNCSFLGNFAIFDGGAILADVGSTTSIVNTAFSGNEADNGGGGALVVAEGSDLVVVGCTFSGNTAIAGGGLACSASDPDLFNCILWGNQAGQGPQVFNSGSAPTFRHCDVGGSGGSAAWNGTVGVDGGGNIDANPDFADADGADGDAGTDDDDLRLQAGSPCIDAGDSGAVDECLVDLDGAARRADDPATSDTGAGPAPIVDLGPYELGADPADCNGNHADDGCDVTDGSSPDCNGNGVPDECDVADGSPDVNGNGIPDECEPDCNGNGVPDDVDVAGGGSSDVNGNGVPDECETDCNGNGVPDDVDIDGGGSNDVNGNGVPDECEADCNGNGVPDRYEVEQGTVPDCNNNAVPDECDVTGGTSGDDDGDGVPDECGPAGLTFTARTITTDADAALCVVAADVDGDGDVDVVSASRNDDTVAWYENDGGRPPAFTPRTITTGANGASAVFAADLDGDGDTDVIAASRNDDTVAWHENLGGTPPAFAERTIATDADAAFDVFAADLDGDERLDVIAASRNDDRVTWYRNDGATPPGFEPHVISDDVDAAVSVWAADLDGDEDVDVLATAFDADRVWWFENAGGSPPAFAPRIVSDAAPEATDVSAADVDGDGAVDVLAATRADDSIVWYRSDGESPPSFGRQVISTGTLGPRAVFPADLDGDGDVDVLSASVDDDTISWHEQTAGDPLPSFTEHIITTAADSAQSVVAADVDGDGDPDVVSASRDDDRIAWYETVPACCPADVTGDGVVDVDDLVAVILAWGACPAPPEGCPADLNGDGAVDVDDLVAVILGWS
ncbi:MAG: FG-GAP-like repeat-containing protein [Planctomycetota bacterium]|jgi:hypothetical protein